MKTNKRIRKNRLFRACAFWVCFGASIATAQVDTGMIAGKVRDSSDAVIADAVVTVTNMATNTKETTRTGNNGAFLAPLLKVGTYSLTVEKPGFQKFIQSGIQVDVQARLELNVTLPVGVVTQEVDVTAAAPLLDTQSANVGQVVGARQVAELPLNGRRYDDLVFLTTGVNSVTPIQAARGEGVFSVDGNTSLQNNFVLDGVDNNSYDENLQSQSAQVAQPPVDAISEFKIQTHTYDVSFGRNAGSVVNATIKSGTNSVHGDVYEFFRNRDLDANDFFLNTAGKPRPQYQRNQIGGVVGAPIKKNHTFIFAGEEHSIIAKGTSLVGSVPTPPDEAGQLFGTGVRAAQPHFACAVSILRLYKQRHNRSELSRSGGRENHGLVPAAEHQPRAGGGPGQIHWEQLHFEPHLHQR